MESFDVVVSDNNIRIENGYSISYVQIWHDINDTLVEWKRQNMQNIDA